jgi:uncharacterized protein
VRVWVDIDNEPQVQYLVPFAEAFEELGVPVTVTARDKGQTLQLLERRRAVFHTVGSQFGSSRRSKAYGLLRRALALRSVIRGSGANLVVCASRPAALAARLLGIPSFVLCDYEFVHLKIYRHLGSHLLFPEVIGSSVFRDQGFDEDRLLAFPGLKEDISFAGLDLAEVRPHAFPEVRSGLTKVLFRPPAEESHYFIPQSKSFALTVLERLARDSRIAVIYVPRYGWQVKYAAELSWGNDPVVLRTPVSFAELLRGVDAVVASGGTMLREAAYLGIPAFSIFRGRTGAVDRHLETAGRVTFIRSREELEAVDLAAARRLPPVAISSKLRFDLAGLILERAA